jgi:hypothetical protein
MVSFSYFGRCRPVLCSPFFQLAVMGFSEARCRRALAAVGPDLERAMDWIFSRMDDPTLDLPPVAAPVPPTSPLEEGSGLGGGGGGQTVSGFGRWVLEGSAAVVVCNALFTGETSTSASADEDRGALLSLAAAWIVNDFYKGCCYHDNSEPLIK